MRYVNRLATCVALVGTLLWVGNARASDFCITESTGLGLTFVGKSFKIPGKGKCKPWIGFVKSGANYPSSGTACTTSDGSEVSVSITTAPFDGITNSLVDFFSFSLPGLGSMDASELPLGGSPTFASGTATAGTCNPPKQTIP